MLNIVCQFDGLSELPTKLSLHLTNMDRDRKRHSDINSNISYQYKCGKNVLEFLNLLGYNSLRVHFISTKTKSYFYFVPSLLISLLMAIRSFIKLQIIQSLLSQSQKQQSLSKKKKRNIDMV